MAANNLIEHVSFARRHYDDAPERSLEHLERLAHWLDDGYRLPGGRVRFGWDTILKILPVVGDQLSLLASIYLYAAIRRFQLPRVTQARIAMYIAVDYIVGMIPIIGAIFDVFWKPNVWSVALVRRRLHLATGEPRSARRARREDFLVVVLAIIFVIAALAALIALAIWVVTLLVHALGGVRL
jgi:Domain of unknown function (DUF4112)